MTHVLILFALFAPLAMQAKTFYVTIAGLGGEPDYEQRFDGLAAETDKYVRAAGGDIEVITLKGAQATKAKVRSVLEQVGATSVARDTFVLLLIGHGNFDGAEYKFNLPGPDITGKELAELLNHIPADRQLVVDTTSASGAILKPFEHSGRLVVSATRDGAERNATVFGRFWIEALHDPAADTDKNEIVTALEAYKYAQRKTTSFYEDQKRIATEHSVLSDTTRAASFSVVRFGSTAAADPAKKQLMTKRDDLESQIDALKQQKNTMAADEYRKQLTALLVDLARTQQEIDK